MRKGERQSSSLFERTEGCIIEASIFHIGQVADSSLVVNSTRVAVENIGVATFAQRENPEWWVRFPEVQTPIFREIAQKINHQNWLGWKSQNGKKNKTWEHCKKWQRVPQYRLQRKVKKLKDWKCPLKLITGGYSGDRVKGHCVVCWTMNLGWVRN